MKTSPTQSLKPHHSVRLTHPAGGPTQGDTTHSSHTAGGLLSAGVVLQQMEPTVGGHSEGAPWTLWGTLGGSTVDTLEGHQGEQPWTLWGKDRGHFGGHSVEALVGQ